MVRFSKSCRSFTVAKFLCLLIRMMKFSQLCRWLWTVNSQSCVADLEWRLGVLPGTRTRATVRWWRSAAQPASWKTTVARSASSWSAAPTSSHRTLWVTIALNTVHSSPRPSTVSTCCLCLLHCVKIAWMHVEGEIQNSWKMDGIPDCKIQIIKFLCISP